MGTPEEIIAAQDAWRDAKRAYDDEAAQYIGVAWLPTVSGPGPVDGGYPGGMREAPAAG